MIQGELEERKAEESYERVLVLQPLRRQFYRKMIRFLDKHLRVAAIAEIAPYIASEICNTAILSFAEGLDAEKLPAEEGSLI